MFICNLDRHKEFLTNIIDAKVLGRRIGRMPKKPYFEDIESVI